MNRKAFGLVLLVYFAGALTIVSAQETPSRSDTNIVGPNPVVVSIPNPGEFYFGKARVAEADIPEKLTQAVKNTPRDERVAYIKASPSMNYGTIISVMNAMEKAGIDRVGLVTNKKSPDAKRTLSSAQPINNSSGPGATTSGPITIYVINKTTLKLNSEAVALSRLGSRLQRLLATRERQTVFIVAPGKMSYGDIVKVIDIAKSAGAEPIGLQLAQF